MRKLMDFQSTYGYSNKSTCYQGELVAGKPFGLVVWANGDEELFASADDALAAMSNFYADGVANA